MRVTLSRERYDIVCRGDRDYGAVLKTFSGERGSGPNCIVCLC